MAKLGKLTKVNDNIVVNRYDNGWMVEVGGCNTDDEWANAKIMCSTEEELLELIQEYNGMEIN